MRKFGLTLAAAAYAVAAVGVAPAAAQSGTGGNPARVQDLEAAVAALEASGAGVFTNFEYVEYEINNDLGNADTYACPGGKRVVGGGAGVFILPGDTASEAVLVSSLPKFPIPDDPGYGWSAAFKADGTATLFVRIICADGEYTNE